MKEIKLVEIDENIIAKYLGYKGNVPDDNIENIIKLCKQDVIDGAFPKYTYKVFDTKFYQDKVEVVGTELFLTGGSIVNHLAGCEKVILLCATLGREIDKYIRKCELTDMTKALIADATASVAIDSYCDETEIYLKEKYPDMHFTFRFGLGYGDLPLALEPIFLNVLDAEKKAGVCTSESLLLNPRKSVACVIGLSSKPVSKQYRGCISCNMRESCQFRIRGEHCGF